MSGIASKCTNIFYDVSNILAWLKTKELNLFILSFGQLVDIFLIVQLYNIPLLKISDNFFHHFKLT